MSDRRKRDRYNETWTKEEVSDSLQKIEREKKSSHRSDKRHHRRDEDDHERRERKRREERDDSSKHKLRSRHHDSRERDVDGLDREQVHRSRRDDDGKRRRDDRHEKHRKSARDDDAKVNGSERRHHGRERDDRRHQDEKSHRSDKRSSRHHDDAKHHNDDPDRRKHSSRDGQYDDEYRERKHRKHESERGGKREKRRDGDEKERDEDRRKKRSERERATRDVDDEDEERRRKKERRRKEKEEYERRKNLDDKEAEFQHRKSERHLKKHLDDEYHQSSDKDKHEEKRDRRSDGKHKDSRRNHKEDSSSTSSKSKKNANSTYIVEKSKEEEKDENEYNYDDEEFEDYADDFEDAADDDDDEVVAATNEKTSMPTEMDALMRAIAAENERANSAQSSVRFRSTVTSTDRNDSPFSQTSSIDDTNRGPMTVINFSAAKISSASSKVKKKMLKRNKDLMDLIQLDSVSFDILEMAPLTEYNLYIKNYGNSNTEQVSVQCNDDNLDQETQTEIPDSEGKWSQHPPHDVKCSGSDKVTNDDENDDDRNRLLSTMRGDSMRLTKFMSRASKLIESILNEDEMWQMSKNDAKLKSKLSFCEGYVPLQTNLAYLQGRNAVHIASSQGSSKNLIAVAFEPAANSFSTRIDRKGLVAVWDSRKPAIPEKILVCDARPTYCSFGSSKSYILFVGTDDGCVLAYDLREAGAHHQIVSLEPKRETILRSATYTTGYLEDGHSSPIVSIVSVGTESKSSEEKQIIPSHFDRRNHSGLAFQLASLEEAARLFLWIVVEMLPESDPDEDLGLAPHGRIKLIRSLSFNTPPPVKSAVPDLLFRTTCVQFSFIDPNNFYVGTDTGHIVHCTQFAAASDGEKIRSSKSGLVFFNEMGTVSPVTSIDVNPFLLFGASLILAGYEDGSLRLYLSDRESSVLCWPFSTEGASIVKVQWSSSRPSVFFVLDSACKLHIWDLAIMHSAPIKTEESHSKPIFLFSLSNSSATRSPEIALSYREMPGNDKSTVEVHKLAPHFSQVTDDQELDQLTFQLQSLL